MPKKISGKNILYISMGSGLLAGIFAGVCTNKNGFIAVITYLFTAVGVDYALSRVGERKEGDNTPSEPP